MKAFIFAVVLVSILSAHCVLGASLEELNSMTAEEKIGFFEDFPGFVSDYANYSDDEINNLISLGLSENDNAILKNILAGIAFEALPHVVDGTRLERTVNEIPGLKSLLINKIRTGWTDDSWIAKKEIPPWWSGYLILVSYYPNDPEVENLIFESMAEIPGTTGDFIQYLDYGHHDSERVKALRLQSVMDEEISVSKAAVNSIKNALPPEGLAVLEAALTRRDMVLLDIVDTISAYGEKATPLIPVIEKLSVDLQSYKGNWKPTERDLSRIENTLAIMKSVQVEQPTN